MVFKRLIKRENVFRLLNPLILTVNFVVILTTGLLGVRTEFFRGMSFGVILYSIIFLTVDVIIEVINTKRADRNLKYLKRGLYRDEI